MADKKTGNKFDGVTAKDVAKMDDATKNALKNSLLGKASTILKSRHEGEYEEIATGLFSDLGLERVKRKTAEEKEREEYLRLAAKYGPIDSAQVDG